jgi:signal transduction histidine kinase
MRLLPAPLKRLLSEKLGTQGRKGLAFQRVVWGSLAGCLASVVLAESPVLESLELEMLKWRYKTSARAAKAASLKEAPADVCIVGFDDTSQFDLGIARFNDQRSQSILGEALTVIEKGEPVLVALDLDLRGAANPDLIRLFRRYRNVVVGLFGTLEGSTDLPAAEFMTHAASYGYTELAREADGMVCRLPLNYQGKSIADEESGFSPVPSLTEAIIDVYRRVKGVGPPAGLAGVSADQPVYINFKDWRYRTVSFQDVLTPGFDPRIFKDKVVMVGFTMTSRRDDPLHCITPLDVRVPEVEVQAAAVSTLLNNQAIYSPPRDIARYVLVLFGAVFGAWCSLLTMGPRTALVLSIALILLVVAQVSFEGLRLAMPVVPPLAVLSAAFVLGTVIFLDTDLRQRNRELAAARESMQVRAEEERQRIAEDLHDETLPALSAVARMADKLAQEMGEHPIPGQMRQKLDGAVSEMRRVINDLHPSVLETMGFVPALENLVNILSRESGIDGNFVDGTGQDDYDMPRFVKLQLYRIVQETLNNVQKHSQASKVELLIEQVDDKLVISVADDGRGIDPALIKRDSHGLLNIRQRAQLIGAQVEWRRPRDFTTGTEVRLKIALNQEKGNG